MLSGQLEVLSNKANELATKENLLSAEVDALRKKTEEGRSFTKRTFVRMNGQSSPFYRTYERKLTRPTW